MKQLLAIGLALLFFGGSLVPSMSAEQIIRLPELVTHFHEHQREEGQNLSAWSFLMEHYSSDSQHHKAPKHSHSRLPSFDGGHSTYDFTPILQLAPCEPLVHELPAVAVFCLRHFNARLALSSLFQPPRR